MRRAKIICTLGPSTFSEAQIENLIRAGMDIVRLNFSHGNDDTYRQVIQIIREKSKKLKKFVPILQDLQGPKIRIGELKKATITLKKGQKIMVTTQNIHGDEKKISIPYEPLPNLMDKGNRILIDDGLIELAVEDISGKEMKCRVLNEGILKAHKGVNVPYLKTDGVSLTAKDLKDLEFGLQHNVDFVALSFVRSVKDIENLRRKLPEMKGIGIIAKIEKREAVDVFDEILEVSDGIMVARGDLAVESSTEIVPCLQKEIIQKCNLALKPVITATQMLESMVTHPRPTRAEASDVANAVLDGSDALMLSSETATGNYPIETVQMMDRIIREVERHHHYHQKEYFFSPHIGYPEYKMSEPGDGSMENAACQLAQGIGAKIISCLSEQGRSAVRLARYRPRQPIIAFTYDIQTQRKLSLVWGVQCYLMKNLLKRGKVFNFLKIVLKRLKWVEDGDRIVVTTGVFTHSPDTTRIIKVHEI
ncbi:MAG: pyruvate kinase [Deltaproteobacteria bacterium]|nr:pyruvate kinase [Deltaproteobacteria bacterium]